jgi:acyl phosphate:glycerol-3-phosphate acyltransferase
MLELALKTLAAYGLGSLMGALLLGMACGVDIRTLGSGNAGGTNALRTQGKWFALGVVLVDVSKGWAAAVLVPAWHLSPLPADPSVSRSALVYACVLAATIGHVYPVWWEFRGGKGAATLIGGLLGAAPLAVPCVIGLWLVIVVLSGYVGLATLSAVATLPGLLPVLGVRSTAATVFSTLLALFVIYTHRSNIHRMRLGTEPRARSLWIGRYFGGRTA